MAANAIDQLTKIGIALVFFLHGAKLHPKVVIGGLGHWRLYLAIFASTFLLFPLLGLALKPLALTVLSPELYLGLLFLCVVPSTVQSSITFTAIAGGNVPAAVCSASASNLAGVFLTPLLISLVLNKPGAISPGVVESIVLQILVPFVVGQFAQRWIGSWLARHKKLTGTADRGSLLLIVYSAFSAATVNGIWHRFEAHHLFAVALMDAILLAVVLVITMYGSRLVGFSREDEITTVFCGSNKSLGTGIPIANIVFAGSAVGTIVLPIMLFHQIQLMVCAILARRYLEKAEQAAVVESRQ